MNTPPEEFEQLQKLLKLKRHEVPPPGYFNNFSTRVLTGIERQNETNQGFVGSWLARVLASLETNPFMAGIFGASVCGLLVAGISWSQYINPSEFSAASTSTMAVADNSSVAASSWAKADNVVDSLSPSINPSLSANVSGSMFAGATGLTAQPVSFSISH